MNISILKIFFVLIFSFTFSTAFAQEKPEAILFDKFGLLDCEDIWAREDAFTAAIQSSPDSVGYAVIYGKQYETKQNLNREKLIAGVLETRGMEKDRFKIIRGKEIKEPHTEFWLVPAGVDKPDFEEAKWDLAFPKNQKPFVFYSSEWDVLCPIGNQLKIYSEIFNGKSKCSRQYCDL